MRGAVKLQYQAATNYKYGLYEAAKTQLGAQQGEAGGTPEGNTDVATEQLTSDAQQLLQSLSNQAEDEVC